MQETEESEESEKNDKKKDKKNDTKKAKDKAKTKEKPAKETKGKKKKELKDEEGEEEMDAEGEDEDEGSEKESDAFDNGEAGDEYMLVLHSVKNKRASHMMGDPSVSIPIKTIGSPRFEVFLSRRTGIARSRVQNPLKSWLCQGSICNFLNCVHNCDDHSL